MMRSPTGISEGYNILAEGHLEDDSLRQDYCVIQVGLETKGLSTSAYLIVSLQACSTIPLHPQIQPRNERQKKRENSQELCKVLFPGKLPFC